LILPQHLVVTRILSFFFIQTPVRPIVVVKTLPTTGQRSSGNVKTVVWDTSPLHGANNSQATHDETDGREQLTTIEVSLLAS